MKTAGQVKSNFLRQLFVTMIYAFVTARLDNYGSLYVGVGVSAVACLHRKIHLHHTQFKNLFIVCQSILEPIFKNFFVFKSLNSLAPPYQPKMLHCYVPARSLWSDHLLLTGQ